MAVTCLLVPFFLLTLLLPMPKYCLSTRRKQLVLHLQSRPLASTHHGASMGLPVGVGSHCSFNCLYSLWDLTNSFSSILTLRAETLSPTSCSLSLGYPVVVGLPAAGFLCLHHLQSRFVR